MTIEDHLRPGNPLIGVITGRRLNSRSGRRKAIVDQLCRGGRVNIAGLNSRSASVLAECQALASIEIDAWKEALRLSSLGEATADEIQKRLLGEVALILLDEIRATPEDDPGWSYDATKFRRDLRLLFTLYGSVLNPMESAPAAPGSEPFSPKPDLSDETSLATDLLDEEVIDLHSDPILSGADSDLDPSHPVNDRSAPQGALLLAPPVTNRPLVPLSETGHSTKRRSVKRRRTRGGSALSRVKRRLRNRVFALRRR